MMIKKWSAMGIVTLLLLVVAGCGDKPTAAPVNGAESNTSTVVSGAGENPGTNAPVATSTTQPTVESNPASPEPTSTPVVSEKQSQSIEVYYTDLQVMNLLTGKTTISYSNDLEKYGEAFKALQSSENTDLIPLWSKIELKSLNFADGQLRLDIHKPDEAQLGAGGESFAISALTKTYFQFDEVKSIELLVDGEKVESLMGHVDLPHPMTRDNS